MPPPPPTLPPQQQRGPHRQPRVAARGPAGHCCHLFSVNLALKHHKGVCNSSRGRTGGSWAWGVVRCGRQVLVPDHIDAPTDRGCRCKLELLLTKKDVAALTVLAIDVSQACKHIHTEML